MTAFYNEIDPYAAQWLRNLIKAGHIAPGVVDERSIEDIAPEELSAFTQCHFFAGVGVWSLALRRAGWPDDRPVWTGSCPCQPFSAAGQGAGFTDARHLWPSFAWLIANAEPAVVFGEQVASKAVEPWVDLVHADMETMGYAFGAIPFPSAGVGAPHIRDRLFWVGHANNQGLEGLGGRYKAEGRRIATSRPITEASELGRLADPKGHGHERAREFDESSGRNGASYLRSTDRLANEESGGRREERQNAGGGFVGNSAQRRPAGSKHGGSDLRPGPVNGFWRDADWLGCRDDKWRPVSAKPQPLVDGSAESLGRVCARTLEKIEEEINATTAQSEGSRAKTMRDLLIHLGAEAQRGWPTGRLPGLHEAPFLLSFLRQLQEQGWCIAEGVALPRPEAAQAYMRKLRDNAAPAGTSRKHGLAGQQPVECTNAVHFLSSLLARHAHSAWGHAYSTYAEIGFPLANGARSRVGRLRAYGNAINAEAATQFIASFLDCTLIEE